MGPGRTGGGAGRCSSRASRRCRSRGLLYAASDHPGWLAAAQALDGISLGALDALLALVLADVTRGTGRYNAARGVVGTVQGVGGSLSNAAAGLVVARAGYDAAFLALAAVGLVALLLVLAAMPETRPGAPGDAA